MFDLNSLLVPWTIEHTAKPFPKPEILTANRIIRAGIKTIPEALEAAVEEVLANHQVLLEKLFKRVADDAKQLVKTHRTSKMDFDVFWKAVFCEQKPGIATNTSGYLHEVIDDVFGGHSGISVFNLVLLLCFFYQSVELAFLGKTTDSFVLLVPTDHQFDPHCLKYVVFKTKPPEEVITCS